MISLPLRVGILTDAGKYFATGSSSFISPRSTMSCNNSAVNVFVMEPISNSVSPFTSRSVLVRKKPFEISLDIHCTAMYLVGP